MYYFFVCMYALLLPFTMLATSPVIILLGPPASGKGTQAVRVAEKLAVPHISTGDLFRQNMQENSPLGQEARRYIDAGQLVPDQLVLDMLFDRLKAPDAQKGYVLDGFPRTLAQAEALERTLAADITPVVLNLVVSDETITKRALGRQRADDTLAVVQERLRAYYAQTEPLIAYYTKKGWLHNIDAEKTPDEVFAQLITVIQPRQ